MEKCIGCELCAGVCPADCIYVRGLDNPPDHPVSPGERYGYVYEINFLRCIHCDMCVEACPTEAITESKLFEFSFTNRSDAIYTKDELLVDDDGTPKKLPWEDWREGDDLLTSGWMRATSPAGQRRLRGRGPVVRRARLRRARPRGRPVGPARRRGHRHQAAARGARGHLLDEDIPLGQPRACRAGSGGPRRRPSGQPEREEGRQEADEAYAAAARAGKAEAKAGRRRPAPSRRPTGSD